MESEKHKSLKKRAVKYLYNKSYWVTGMEVSCGYYGIYDAWGINNDYKTMGIEVKVSRSDYKNHKYKEAKLESYVPANENYILCPTNLIKPEEVNPQYGLLWFNGERIRNMKKPEFVEMTDRKKLFILFGFLSSKMNKNNVDSRFYLCPECKTLTTL